VLKRAWGWLVPEPWTPLLFSVLGDVFLQKQGKVYWLNTGTGEIMQVADSTAHFEALLKTDLAVEWFMPPFVGALRASGKIASDGQCYTYAIFPVFSEGKYEVENIDVVPASEHFGASGQLHAGIADVPDGHQVRIVLGTAQHH
jgi:hypothetical protein